MPMIAFARRLRTTAIALTLLVAAAPAVAIEPDEAREFVAEMADRATDVLSGDRPMGERRRELEQILRQAFDLEYIGRLVLGPTYRTLSAEQQESYDAAFKQYVLETYSRRIDEYGGEELEILGAESAGSRDVKVQSRVLGVEEGEPVKIDWRVRDRDAGPKIIDVEIEGVSMAISQRSEFASVVDQRGVDGLIAMLEERAAQPS
jgi:phospholipid transport system substrate-binding protein